jgi:hypothetical protein
MQLTILSADKKVFSWKIERISIPSLDGTYAILKNHTDMVAILKKWEISFMPYHVEFTALESFADNNTYLHTEWWICKVENNEILLLLSTVTTNLTSL